MNKKLVLIAVGVLLLVAPAMKANALELEGSLVSDGESMLEMFNETNAVFEGAKEAEVSNNGARMTYIISMGSNLTINSNGIAYVTADADCYPNTTTNLSIVTELQRKVDGNWTVYRTYRLFTGQSYGDIMESCQVPQGYSYRVHTTVTAYSGSDSEVREQYTGERYY